MAVVLTDQNGGYRAVLPVPLRRKRIAGMRYAWVVHQPVFCQFLSVFATGPALSVEPFYALVCRQFRYGSIFCVKSPAAVWPIAVEVREQFTHTLDLSASYEQLVAGYSADRRLNLRRALAAGWVVEESVDPEPIIDLFREYHADAIDGGVADWAYTIFRNLVVELSRRGLATLQYAVRNGRIEAGALFVQEGDRIIYLFNAASTDGRQGQARTLLLDQLIRRQAGQPLILDFESPDKASITAFYGSFGAVKEPYYSVRWNRLNRVEKLVRRIIRPQTRRRSEKP
ncbi:hypothetical protein BN8_00002 [Fibrisoma limi BUZ 3]|uniref:BioF2-like acetyltransferase domain-containing protein n=2 Tax=Fibrisoma limi TaxID=663275 RepID=I2GB25_9BACT|nr:hypothetical protein BN8_00002 [Fibrisoma limi BUZ 3]